MSGSTVAFLTMWYACAAMTATSGALEFSMRQLSENTNLGLMNMIAAAVMALIPITETVWSLRGTHDNGRVIVYGICYIGFLLLQLMDGPANLARAVKEKDEERRRKMMISGVLSTLCVPLLLTMPFVMDISLKRQSVTVVPDKPGTRYEVVPRKPVVPRPSSRVAPTTTPISPVSQKYGSYRSPSAMRSRVVPWDEIKEDYKNF